MQPINSSEIYIFIGTTAEFIKIMPIMNALEKKNLPYKVISTGQNDLKNSSIWNLVPGKSRADFVINSQNIKQTPLGLFIWFFKSFFKGCFLFNKLKSNQKTHPWLLVHGDTISTLLGALLAKIYGFKICHIEAGLRSFNYLKPFPEEICRVIVSKLSSLAICPNSWALNNLKNHRYPKINTRSNTLYDAVFIAKNNQITPSKEIECPAEFFLMVLHRQENLFDKVFFNKIIERILLEAQKTPCVFIIHDPTLEVLSNSDLYSKLKANSNITLLRRLEFPDFIKLIDKASFVLTDGGSNQEETYFLGKPCLVLRKETERIEGLERNVILSKKDFSIIEHFLKDPKKYKKAPILIDQPPSEIAVHGFIENLTIENSMVLKKAQS